MVCVRLEKSETNLRLEREGTVKKCRLAPSDARPYR
jgi:hypothetical protein